MTIVTVRSEVIMRILGFQPHTRIVCLDIGLGCSSISVLVFVFCILLYLQKGSSHIPGVHVCQWP